MNARGNGWQVKCRARALQAPQRWEGRGRESKLNPEVEWRGASIGQQEEGGKLARSARTGCGPKYRHARMQPPTLSPEDSDAAASAAHAPYTRLCAAEAAEA